MKLKQTPKGFIKKKTSLSAISAVFKLTNVPSAFVQQSPHPLNINGHALYVGPRAERVRIIKVRFIERWYSAKIVLDFPVTLRGGEGGGGQKLTSQ